MYDRQWARSIVENYQKLYPRVQQIDNCLQQLYLESRLRSITRKDIQDRLIDSVQDKRRAVLWRDYKRLVKRTPLDKELLIKVSGYLNIEVDVEKIQRQFEWD